MPVLLASALLAVLSALAFPLAPVTQPTVDVALPPPGAPAVTALPLMPYQPVTLRASASCEVIRATPPGAAVLATVGPWVLDGDTGGLRMRAAGAGLAVSSNGIALATVPLPPGPCTVTVDTTAERTVVALDGAPVATTDADVRPVVSALWTAAPSTAGLAVALRTDTRFQTTPSALKWALGAGVVLGVAGVAACAVLADRAAHPRRARRRAVQLPLVHPGPVDAVVVVGLAIWAVIGPATVDDGYIAGIVRGRGENGFVGNVYRWLNAPEAPFSWFYDLDRAWAALAPGPGASVLWLRVPAMVLGVLIWAVLRRHVLPRLGPALTPPSARWTAALVFAAWWLPFGLSLRPEPWVALGVLAVWASTERAVATGRSTPLVVAAGLGGLTVALTPGALGGLVPLVVALPALARRTRSRTTPGTVGAPTLPVTARLAAVVAGGTLAVLAMAGDQGLDGLREAARVRTVIGGGLPWYQELTRYTALLTPGDVQGSLGARLPVLLLLVALGAVTWSVVVRRVRIGVATAPAVRLLATVTISLVLLTLSPTKWTLHFGGLAGIGTAAVTLLVVAWGPRGVRALRRREGGTGQAGVVVLGAVLLAGALVLAGRNQWAYASDWGVPFTGGLPSVAGLAPSTIVLVAGGAAVGLLAVVVAVRAPGRGLPRPLDRLVAPGVAVVVLTTAVVTLVAASFVVQTLERRDTFAYGSDALAALGGDPCGLPRLLTVEPDPSAGLLPTAAPSVLDGFAPVAGPGPAVPLAVAGRLLPGWTGTETGPATLVSGWSALPAAGERAGRPVVVAVSGTAGHRADVVLEFSDGRPGADGPPRTTATTTPGGDTGGTATRDLRAEIPADAALVRVRATSAARDTAVAGDPAVPSAAGRIGPAGTTPDVPLTVGVPRVPRTVPFDALVPPGTTVLADWPVALVAPCLRPPALTGGTAELPPWRLVPPGLSDAGEIAVAAATGGPFLTARQLVDEVRIPVYLHGDPVRDAVGLARWVPRAPLGAVTPAVGAQSVSGAGGEGRATVPGLDPVDAPAGG